MEHWTKIGYKNHCIKFPDKLLNRQNMLAAKTLISPSRKFNTISLITTVYHVINKEVANSKPYVIKVALDHFIFLTEIFGSYKNKTFKTFF